VGSHDGDSARGRDAIAVPAPTGVSNRACEPDSAHLPRAEHALHSRPSLPTATSVRAGSPCASTP
jgi:hypothetical protein